jgi:hypothetical protein
LITSATVGSLMCSATVGTAAVLRPVTGVVSADEVGRSSVDSTRLHQV